MGTVGTTTVTSTTSVQQNTKQQCGTRTRTDHQYTIHTITEQYKMYGSDIMSLRTTRYIRGSERKVTKNPLSQLS